MNCCIIGIGKHSSRNLIPALQKLQIENLIKIKYLCRNDVLKGDGGLGVPVINYFPEDIDFLIACGHPSLHQSVIDFSNKTGIPCLVEKPHLIDDQFVNERVMIGYNFNFMSISPSIKSIDTINCGTKGLYKSWQKLFNGPLEKYQHALHSVIVHPISVIVQKYGAPSKVHLIDESNDDDANDVNISIELTYSDKTRFVNYSTDYERFEFDIVSGDVVTKCKPYKADSYYNMLKYYVQSNCKPVINNAVTGKHTLSVINTCLDILEI